MAIIVKELVPNLWPQVELLFGKRGACGGCWCQAWRVEKGERWDDIKGATAKRRFREGILNRSVHGVIAFDNEKPVGWCSFGPRDTFPRLNRARTLHCDDSAHVWSLPCFYVLPSYRKKGIARAMLQHALKVMKSKGVALVEGYPSKPNADGQYIAAFSWTGTLSLFDKAGFTTVGNREGSKRRVRKRLSAGIKGAKRKAMRAWRHSPIDAPVVSVREFGIEENTRGPISEPFLNRIGDPRR
jgi:GNAT superfamily N-acetyltransferase